MCSFQGTINGHLFSVLTFGSFTSSEQLSLSVISFYNPNGDNEDRTRDLLLARQALSQLSYTPIGSGTHLLSHAVPSVVSSAVRGLTIVFGMGTGVSPGRIGTRNFAYPVVSASEKRNDW